MLHGQSKPMIEIMIAIAGEQPGIRLPIARRVAFAEPGLPLGLPLDSNHAIDNFIEDSMGGGEIHVNGDRTPLRSCLYSADLPVCLLQIPACGWTGVPYDVEGDGALSIGDLIRSVAGAAGNAVPLPAIPAPDEGGAGFGRRNFPRAHNGLEPMAPEPTDHQPTRA